MMANLNQDLIVRFYTAFEQRDYATMQGLYHAEAEFHDPVFQTLNCAQVKSMWQMLLTGAKDLEVTFKEVQADDQSGKCKWEAVYTFMQTNRKVHNIIHAEFEFKDGKIFRHRDDFDFWRWSRMALGFSGVLLGWSTIVKNKVRQTAQGRLKKFMTSS